MIEGAADDKIMLSLDCCASSQTRGSKVNMKLFTSSDIDLSLNKQAVKVIHMFMYFVCTFFSMLVYT